MRVSVLAAALVITVFGMTFAPSGGSASAAEEITQCNGVENTGGLGLNCAVTVINNLDTDTGVESSTVEVTDCRGFANTDLLCTTVTTSYDSLTTSVNQCNNAANGGGSSVVCTVTVTNNVTGSATANITEATVNQCNGSGAEGTAPTLNCDPVPASTTNATITQCNGSVNGGGASDRVECTVTPSTVNEQLPVSINQCNDTANGGGSVVTCTASLTNIVLAAAPIIATPTPTSTSTPTPTQTPTAQAVPSVAKNTLHDSNTDGFTHAATNEVGSPVLLGLGALLLTVLLAAVLGARRLGARQLGARQLGARQLSARP